MCLVAEMPLTIVTRRCAGLGRIVRLREHNIAAAVRESRVSDLPAGRYFVDAHAIEDRRKTSRDHLRMSPT